jgi:hypothetical protein
VNGKLIVGGLVVVALSAGIGLWYSQTYAYYARIDGLTEVNAYGGALAVTQYRGIDADTSPLKLRACFKVDWDYVLTDTYQREAEPLVAPRWFDCFDAVTIAQDIAAGDAVALLAEQNHPFGFSRFIAQYPDGRAFMWRQLNACGRAEFAGEDLPEGCLDGGVTEVPKPVHKANLALPMTRSIEVPKRHGIATGDVVISLTPVNGGLPEAILQEGMMIASDSAAPNSLWACFTTPLSMALLTESYEVVDGIAPQNPANSLPCFDAEQLKEAVSTGQAVAFLGERNVLPGVDRIVAVYQDGRALAWHQQRAN